MILVVRYNESVYFRAPLNLSSRKKGRSVMTAYLVETIPVFSFSAGRISRTLSGHLSGRNYSVEILFHVSDCIGSRGGTLTGNLSGALK